MKYEMARPCSDCPFRIDTPFVLGEERAEEIAYSNGEFACHKTTVMGEDDEGEEDLVAGPNSQHCAGMLIMLELLEEPHQMMRICERIHLYDRTTLDMDFPVFEDREAFVEHHASEKVRSRAR